MKKTQSKDPIFVEEKQIFSDMIVLITAFTRIY